MSAPRLLDRRRGRLPGHVHRGDVRRGPEAALAVPPHEVRGRADRARAAVRAVAGVPAGDRRRGLAHRGDGQGRRALLLLQGDPAAAPAGTRMGAARRRGPGTHQHRAGRLGGGRDGAPDPPTRPRRLRLPPDRPPAPACRRARQRARRRRARAANRGDARPPAHARGAHVAVVARGGAPAVAPARAPRAARAADPRGGRGPHGARAALRQPRHAARTRRHGPGAAARAAHLRRAPVGLLGARDGPRPEPRPDA